MKPEIPDILRRQARAWDELHRSARRELGRDLRRLGLMQSEIRKIIPMAKSTLSNWCRDVELTAGQIAAIRQRGYSQPGVPRDTQPMRRAEVNELRRLSYVAAEPLFADPLFAAGVALYWAEGSKTQSDLTLANTDPALLRLFISWVRSYLAADAEFRLNLHLHDGNIEPEARQFWRRELGLPTARCTKTYLKPGGTGHRKNRLQHGVCRVRVCRSTDMWHTTMAWIEYARDRTRRSVATLAPGR